MPTLKKSLITEALTGKPVQTGEPGRYLLRIIDAGEGSTAFYPPAVLKQAAADRIFSLGTQMHLDHPTEAEERERPIRSMKDLAAVFIEDAYFNEDAQALDVPIKVAAPYQPLIEDLWEYIGASIHAFIEAEDKPGKPVAKRFVPDPRNTVDFVTKAGRGGRVLEVLESARGVEATSRDRREQLSIAVKDAYQTEPNGYIWVRDFDESSLLVWFDDNDDRCWQQSYQVADDDLSVSLTGDAIEVRPVVQYVPVNPEGETESNKEANMPQIDEAKLAALTAAADRVSTLEAQLAEKDTKIAERDRALKARENADKARDALKVVEGFDKLPEAAQEKLLATLPTVPVNEAGDIDGEKFNTVAAAAVKSEADYLAKVAPVNESLRGFGDSRPATEGSSKRTRDAWGDPIKNQKEH